MTDVPGWIDDALSSARFGPYLSACSGDVERALALYRWNVDVSQAFFVPLHWTETVTRNAIHVRLAEHFKRNDWWETGVLDANGDRAVVRARAQINRSGRAQVSSDSFVAELGLGFWVSLVARRYHRTLWVPALTRAFPRRHRGDVHADLDEVRVLRNRVMHHEPVHRRDLGRDHARLLRIVEQLCPEAALELAPRDTVLEVLARRP